MAPCGSCGPRVTIRYSQRADGPQSVYMCRWGPLRPAPAVLARPCAEPASSGRSRRCWLGRLGRPRWKSLWSYPAFSLLLSSPPPRRLKLALACFRLAPARLRQGFACCCCRPSCASAAATTPAEPTGNSKFPAEIEASRPFLETNHGSFPVSHAGRPPRLGFRDLPDVHPSRPARSLNRPIATL